MKIRTLMTAAAAAAAAGAICAAPLAGAAPNDKGVSHANEKAAGGIGVASAAGQGRSGVLSAVSASAPSQAQPGLTRAAAAGGNARSGGVSSATGNGAGPVLAAVRAKAPSQAQAGLTNAECKAAGVCVEEPPA